MVGHVAMTFLILCPLGPALLLSWLHPAHLPPQPNTVEGKQPSKSKARCTFLFKGTPEVISGWWIVVMGDISFFFRLTFFFLDFLLIP